MPKRDDYIGWDSYFMLVAFLSSLRSKDPSTRHGSCIVDKQNKIISVGYNGFPIGCDDDVFPWNREGEFAETKMPYVVHSEINAILNSKSNLEGCRLYLYSEKGYYPCNECAKAIIQSGIKEVIVAFLISKDTDLYSWEPTRRMFHASNVKISEVDAPKMNGDINVCIDALNLMQKNINTTK